MSAPEATQRDLLVLFGARIGRDTAVYAAGTAMVLPFSLVTVAVLTRYLDPSEYGRLAVAFVFASLLTTLYNLGSLQGTLVWVFGSAAEEVDLGPTGGAAAGTRRRALGTGSLLTLAIAAAATVPLLVWAEPIGRLLFDADGQAALVRWAAASAAAGSLWRLVLNVLRMERRSKAFTAMSAVRPALVLAAAWALVAAGHGVLGAIAGTALGTFAGVLVCLGLGRRSYAVSFHVGDARRIAGLGARFVAVTLGLWVVHNADVFILSRFVSEDEVGLYRLAGRVAAFVSYFVSAFLMAWVPLEATSLFQAAYRRAGRAAIRSELFTYYVVAGLALVLAMAAAADLLVRIAAPSFADAAPLIAPIGLGFVFYGAFIVLVRTASIDRRYLSYGGTSLACAAVFVGLSLILIPWLESYGAALSVVLAMAFGCAVFMRLIARGNAPLPFRYGRLAGAFGLALACWALARYGGEAAGSAQALVEVLALIAFAVALVAFGIVPRRHLVPLARVIRRSFLPQRAHAALLGRLEELDPADRSVVDALARDGLPAARAAAELGLTEPELGARLVAALRRLDDREHTTAADAEIGAYLLSEEPPSERDAHSKRLWEAGVDPWDLHALEQAFADLRRAPRRAWPRSGAPLAR